MVLQENTFDLGFPDMGNKASIRPQPDTIMLIFTNERQDPSNELRSELGCLRVPRLYGVYGIGRVTTSSNVPVAAKRFWPIHFLGPGAPRKFFR